MPPITRLGLRLPTSGVAGLGPDAFEQLTELCGAAERAGFDSLWVDDRCRDSNGVAPTEAGPVSFEAMTLLGALAVRTTRARLGTLVTPAGLRPPAVVAKQATTIDLLSNGRMVLGLGVGAGESVPGGSPFEALEDAVRICRALFESDDAVTVIGRRLRVEGAVNRPPPFRSPGPPIVVEATDAQRTLPTAVALADGCVLPGPPAMLRSAVERIGALCQEYGRDRRSFSVTALVTAVLAPDGTDPATVAAELEAAFGSGVDGVVLEAPPGLDPGVAAELGRRLSEAFGS
jgi:alkanesulfonate monooxygenase SsuD/methylene tetrahydromethanopterin reductase-like flavin-dependent oxidoreductase (luciferase family)